MKPTTIAALLSSALSLGAQAQLIPFLANPGPQYWPKDAQVEEPSSSSVLAKRSLRQLQDQTPMASENNNERNPTTGTSSSDTVILSDVLGAQRSINLFAGFTRDVSSVAARLEDALQNTTVLAPLNAVIADLPRKPWEDPADYSVRGQAAYVGEEGQGRAFENLERFTQAHVVPESPWEEGVKVKRVAGGEVWWEKDAEGKIRVMPGDVEVQGIVSRVGNGEVWVLKGVLNYEK